MFKQRSERKSWKKDNDLPDGYSQHAEVQYHVIRVNDNIYEKAKTNVSTSEHIHVHRLPHSCPVPMVFLDYGKDKRFAALIIIFFRHTSIYVPTFSGDLKSKIRIVSMHTSTTPISIKN